jgi:hypothetical protein
MNVAFRLGETFAAASDDRGVAMASPLIFRSRSRVRSLGRGTIFYVALDRDYPLDGLVGHEVRVDGHTFDVADVEAIAIRRDCYRSGEVVGLLAPFFFES